MKERWAVARALQRTVAARARSSTTLVGCAMACAMLLPLRATAQEGAQGTQPTDLVVRITNESGDPVAGHEVAVVLSDGQQFIDELTGTTTDAGEARFEAVPVATGYTARPVAVFEDYPYQGDAVALSPGAEANLPLTVYSVGEGAANLHIEVLHIILNVVEPGVYQALQVMSVLNVGERAAYSDEEFDGRRVGMVIPVPSGVGLVEPVPQISGLDLANLAQDGSRLLDLRPIPPGTHQFAVQYEILTGAEGEDLEILLPYPTAQVSMLVGPGLGLVEVESDQLQELEPVDIPGQGQYANFSSDVINAGATLRFRIGPPQAPMSVGSWALLGLAAALAAGAAASIMFGAGRAPAHAAPVDRNGLLAQVARLDEQHESGALDDADYHARRGAAIERLMELDGPTAASPTTPRE